MILSRISCLSCASRVATASPSFCCHSCDIDSYLCCIHTHMPVVCLDGLTNVFAAQSYLNYLAAKMPAAQADPGGPDAQELVSMTNRRVRTLALQISSITYTAGIHQGFCLLRLTCIPHTAPPSLCHRDKCCSRWQQASLQPTMPIFIRQGNPKPDTHARSALLTAAEGSGATKPVLAHSRLPWPTPSSLAIAGPYHKLLVE